MFNASKAGDISPKKLTLLRGGQLVAVFVISALLMLAYESVKELLFKGSLSMWQSHMITMLVTASFATCAAWLMRRWAQRVNDELRIAATAFEAQEGILVTDAQSNILRVNSAFMSITGYSEAEVVGKTPRILNSGRHDASFYAGMWEQIKRTGSWEGEIWNRRKNGEIYPERLAITAVRNAEGVVTNYVATLTDITMSRAAAEEIQHLAFYDPLTRLPNRRLLMDRLKQAFTACVRNRKMGALLFIDLDDFKSLNDSLGHDFGDLLLQQVGQRTEACVREGDTVARLGGDEFVVMLEGLGEDRLMAATQAENVADKILAALRAPYQLSGHRYHNTPSIGVTLFDGKGDGIDELFKQADIAMYQAKRAGRNAMRFFDPEMQVSVNARADLESDLHIALETGQFELHYQVQMDAEHRSFGAEALIRWMHPERGQISPAHFMPLAEETGLIEPIGQWVLETACAQLKAWQDNPQARDLILSVNVSPRQFRQTGFIEQVRHAVRSHAINPNQLKLELTENILLEDVENTIRIMGELKAIGIRFSLDDFGTGYSSLQYLKRLPLDQIKIDRSFVQDLATDRSDKAIVRTILAMAASLKLDIIAEGVEQEEQRQLLMKKGCGNYQGYLLGRPMPIEQFNALLK